MELKTTVSLIVFIATTFSMISAPAIIMTDEAFAKKGRDGISISGHNSVHKNGKNVSSHSNHGKSSGGGKNSRKSCNPHGCKGTKGFYTVKGHHHCFQGSSGCVQTSHYKHK